MYLGIDIGTTATKVVLYGQNSQIAIAQCPNNLITPAAGWAEQDPNELFANVVQALNQLPTRAVSSCAITNQRETIVPVRKSTNEALYNAISWMDVRTLDICNRFAHLPASSSVIASTGLKFSPFFSVFKMIWLLENADSVKQAASENDLIFLTVDSWIHSKLTNSIEYLTDISNASRTMLLDLDSFDYHDDLLEFFGISKSWLPLVKPSFDNFGQITKTLPFGGTLVNVLIGDQQSSLLGHWGAELKAKSKCTFGTGAFLLKVCKARPEKTNNHLLTLLNTGAQTEFVAEYPIVCAGSLVSWLQDKMGLITLPEDLNYIQTNVPLESSLYFIPNLSGCLFPMWDSSLTGSLHGLSLSSTKTDVCLAVLESIAFCIRLATTHDRPGELSIDGGMSNNSMFCQLLANICQFKIRKLAYSDATCFGAIALSSSFSVSLPDDHEIIIPDTDLAAYYDSKFEKWLKLCIRVENLSAVGKDHDLLTNSPNSSIFFKAGELIAVCGPSNSGKSALLYSLAGARVGTRQYGKVDIVIDSESRPRCRHCWFKLTRLVPHSDIFPPSLTCRQYLSHYARLNKNQALEEESNKLIGDLTSNGNLEAKSKVKLLGIGAALTAKPIFLLIDEPFSLLDSGNFKTFSETLKTYSSNTAASNRKCQYCKIDFASPKACVLFALNSTYLLLNDNETLNQFDKWLLLSKARQIVYFGPLSQAERMLGVLSRKELLECLERVTQDSNISTSTKKAKTCRSHSGFRNNMRSFPILFRRHFQQTLNSKKQLIRVILERILIFTLLSFVFEYPASRSSLLGLYFFLPINQTANTILFTSSESFYPNELETIERDQFACLYHASTVLLVKYLLFCVFNILPALVYLPVVFYVSAITKKPTFPLFILANILNIIASVSIGLFIASTSKNQFNRNLWLFGTSTLLTTFGGIHTAANYHLPWIIRWIQYRSPTYYLFLILLQLEFSPSELETTLTLGKFYLSIGTGFAALGGLVLFYLLLAVAAISRTTHPQRKL